MFERTPHLTNAAEAPHLGMGPDSEVCSAIDWSDKRRKEMACRAVVNLIVELGRIADSNHPEGRRISLLRELDPTIVALCAQIPKPVVSSRQSGSKSAAGQTMEQRLVSAMVKNLKLALDDLERSEAARARTSKWMRSWLLRRLFDYAGGQIEYAVRWDRPYPPGVWRTLHELYFYLQSREDVRDALNTDAANKLFDPALAYRRLLLLGLVQQLVPAVDRSPLLLEVRESLAGQSRLKHPFSCGGAFGFFLVEIARDKPPRFSGGLDHEINGWVLEPGREFLDLVAAATTAGGIS